MAKKRKSRTSQPAAPIEEPINQPEQQQQQELEPTVNDDEQPPDETPQNLNQNNQQQQQQHEEEDDEEEEEDEQEEEEEASLNEVKQEANGEKTDEEPLEKLLEPFSKEQLVLLVTEAVSKHPELMESVEKIADADPAHRKVFVHGLGWDTTCDVLISEFGKYGEIEDCKHVVDKVSGKSKGYAFLLFKHRAGAHNALREPQKKIGNRTTSCQLASAGPVPAPPPNPSPLTQRKIFVSNVAADIDPKKLFHFFAKFGDIDDGPLGLDKQTGKPKGFALFVYKTLEGAKKALEEPHKIFEGHTLHCQQAVDGPKPGKPFFQPPHQHHPAKKSKYSGSGGHGHGHGHAHLMAPSGPSVGYNPGVPPLNPALGQALTALLASQGGGLGNLLGLGGAPQGMPPAGYGNQAGGSYGAQPGMQGGYPNQQGGQGGGRQQQGGGPYMGHGH